MTDTITSMIGNARQAIKHAYAPYSNYTVASCIRSEDDTLFTGVNVENAAYGLTVCAEISAISQMVSSGKRHIKSIVILAGDNQLCPPCGACRQCIQEFSIPETLVYLCDKDAILKTMTIDELLPLAFKLKG